MVSLRLQLRRHFQIRISAKISLRTSSILDFTVQFAVTFDTNIREVGMTSQPRKSTGQRRKGFVSVGWLNM